MLASKLLSSLSGQEEKLYPEDCFSTYLYTGNGSTQTINNGIDLAGKGGLVWIKNRNQAVSHALFDTSRGADNRLASDLTSNQFSGYSPNYFASFNSNGFSLGGSSDNNIGSGTTGSYVSWTFRKAPKFFDCGTFTRTSSANRRIIHSLGVSPGMVVFKRVNDVSSWLAYHRSLGRSNGLFLNNTNAQFSQSNCFGTSDPTSSDFGIDEINGLGGAAGDTWGWYAFAHDPSADGIVQCGSFTTDASGNATVNLGWEPQYVMVKSHSAGSAWVVLDTSRGWAYGANDKQLLADQSSAEYATAEYGQPNATGFNFSWFPSSFIYLAIRRPNKPPTTGTQVYNAIARTGTGAAATVTGVGFAPDLFIGRDRAGVVTASYYLIDRLRGTGIRDLNTNSTAAEGSSGDNGVTSFDMNGCSLSSAAAYNASSVTYINHFFKRAPGVFSVLCDTGTGANKTVNHDLGVPPELWLRKGRSGATEWVWGSSLLLNTEKIVMPSPNGRVTDTTVWNSTYPTATLFSVGTSATTNTNAATYVTYLWSTLSGVSKVFSYTGNGSSQTIDCGFTTGARFVMILRVTASTAQDVFVWDSARGIVSGSDPRISLNTTAAEVTGLDSVDPASSGFIVNTDSSNININGAVYIGLAYA